jgi:hypothetical protein
MCFDNSNVIVDCYFGCWCFDDSDVIEMLVVGCYVGCWYMLISMDVMNLNFW